MSHYLNIGRPTCSWQYQCNFKRETDGARDCLLNRDSNTWPVNSVILSIRVVSIKKKYWILRSQVFPSPRTWSSRLRWPAQSDRPGLASVARDTSTAWPRRATSAGWSRTTGVTPPAPWSPWSTWPGMKSTSWPRGWRGLSDSRRIKASCLQSSRYVY